MRAQNKTAIVRDALLQNPNLTREEFEAEHPECKFGHKNAFFKIRSRLRKSRAVEAAGPKAPAAVEAAAAPASSSAATALAADFLAAVPAQKLVELFHGELLAALEQRIKADPIVAVLALRRLELEGRSVSDSSPEPAIEFPEAILARVAEGRRRGASKARRPKRGRRTRAADADRAVLDYISKHPDCTRSDICTRTGLTEHQCAEARHRLLHKHISRHGRPARYSIKES